MLAATFQISIGDKIELRLQLSDGSYSANVFPSQVQDVFSKSEFLILSPSGSDLDKWIGRIVQLTVIRKGDLYISTAKITSKTSENSLSFLRLVLSGNFRRTQRRTFYRLEINLETDIAGYGKFSTVDI
ncbi:MAG TPA: hypothetical protein VN462_11330, partial [Negativicutes bacterium]|nr:hypothetical protein [Negativicutes bacterium]